MFSIAIIDFKDLAHHAHWTHNCKPNKN